jgi:hypothetical protein
MEEQEGKELGAPASECRHALRCKSSRIGMRSGLFTSIVGALALMAAGCSSAPNHYQLATRTFVPDSLKDDVAKCIIATTSGSSFHLTTADYEDVDDTI